MNQQAEIAIEVKNVNKRFIIPHQKNDTLKSNLLNPKALFNNTSEQQEALDDVSFKVKNGDFFGIVGRNGSGKSTLLKTLAGVYSPDTGETIINGTLVPFIELGVGFNPNLSGRDNVFLNGSLLGFSRDQMKGMYDDIIEFSELERFMDQKLKNYSSGMQVRLAFSIAIRARGDILMLDEVLAVGDTLFQQKCFDYFLNLKKTKKTVLLVSHNASVLEQYCTNGILLESGKIVESGPIKKVLNKYMDIISEEEGREADKKSSKKQKDAGDKGVHGTGKVKIDKIEFLNAKREISSYFTDKDESVVVRGLYHAKKDVEKPIYGIVIRDASGQKIFSSNNMWLSVESPSLKKGDKQQVSWEIPNIFNTGVYYISPAVADYSGKEVYESIDDHSSFRVRKRNQNTSLTNPAHKIVIEE